MNWQNYARLVQHMETMRPEEFDYSSVDLECGCLVSQVRRLTQEDRTITRGVSIFLGLEDGGDEHRYLIGSPQPEIDVNSQHYTSMPSPRGAIGIREALRRLAVVAARHGGPPKEVAPFTGDEAAFLASVRAVAAEVVRS